MSMHVQPRACTCSYATRDRTLALAIFESRTFTEVSEHFAPMATHRRRLHPPHSSHRLLSNSASFLSCSRCFAIDSKVDFLSEASCRRWISSHASLPDARSRCMASFIAWMRACSCCAAEAFWSRRRSSLNRSSSVFPAISSILSPDAACARSLVSERTAMSREVSNQAESYKVMLHGVMLTTCRDRST
jgi:hypothetical protein